MNDRDREGIEGDCSHHKNPTINRISMGGFVLKYTGITPFKTSVATYKRECSTKDAPLSR